MKKRTAIALMMVAFIIGAMGMFFAIDWYGKSNISSVSTEKGMSKEDLQKVNDVYRTISGQ